MLLTHFRRFLRFCNKNFKIKSKINNFTDKRKKYQIPLANIFLSMLYSSLLDYPTFLSKDHLNREPFFKKFLGCKRKMIASDSTLFRNLSNNLCDKEIEEINICIAKKIENILINPVLNKRCGIMDGSGFGHNLYEVLFIPGKIDLILKFNKISKKGTELNSENILLKDTKDNFGTGFFDLFIGDGLYYSKHIFRVCIEELKSNLLVKTTERLNVVKDVEFYIENNAPEVIVEKGFDEERMCEYTIKVVKEIYSDTIQYPLQVAIITEHYIKPRKGKTDMETFYVITSDLSLYPFELRYASHLRWRIENNGFKTMNNVMSSKKKKSKDQMCCINTLWIIFIAYNLLNLFIYKNKEALKEISGSIVVTIKYWIKSFYNMLILEYSGEKGFI